MYTRFGILFTAAFILSAWQSDVDAPATVVQLEFDNLSPEHRDALLRYLVEKNLGEGNWIEKHGVLMCEGFLTEFEYDDYCSSVVPEDWVPFEYQGQEFFVQPLSGKVRN